jgi:hypothetical protein
MRFPLQFRATRAKATPNRLHRHGFRRRFLTTVLPGSRLPLQPGPSHELTLEALIDASQMLTEHLRLKLDELRQHQDE